MAFERNVSVSLRYLLLIALFILVINALSSDYGVNGEDPGVNEKSKSVDKGVEGAKGSDFAPGTSEVTKKQRRKKPHTKTSLSPLGLVAITQVADGLKQASSQSKNVLQNPPSPDEKSSRMGATGSSQAIKAVKDSSSTVNNEDAEKADTLNKDDESPKRPSKTGSEGAARLSKVDYEDEDEEQDSAEIQLNPSGNTFAKTDKEALHKKSPVDDVSSAGSFMTYFVIVAIIVIIGYLVLHNKKKLMAYIVEGRNTGRSRRQRPTSGNGSEYKPLKNSEEVPGGRLEEA